MSFAERVAEIEAVIGNAPPVGVYCADCRRLLSRAAVGSTNCGVDARHTTVTVARAREELERMRRWLP
ncbi:MAG TPA: hypothetical protein VFA70_02100 [Dehalococcoidia bacterium]|nr:hypothetical protein [Dehalococcoidia bacterium]